MGPTLEIHVLCELVKFLVCVIAFLITAFVSILIWRDNKDERIINSNKQVEHDFSSLGIYDLVLQPSNKIIINDLLKIQGDENV